MIPDIQASEFPALWAEYVNKGQIDSVIGLYHENSILMPTFSPHTLKNPQQINDYFLQLASRDSLKVSLHTESFSSSEIDKNHFVLNGIYSFQFKVDNDLLTFPSRFTFVVDISSQTPILHHHSSQIPRTLS